MPRKKASKYVDALALRLWNQEEISPGELIAFGMKVHRWTKREENRKRNSVREMFGLPPEGTK